MMIGVGDAQSLLNHFKQIHTKDPMYFFIGQVDQEIVWLIFNREMGDQGLIMIALGCDCIQYHLSQQ